MIYNEKWIFGLFLCVAILSTKIANPMITKDVVFHQLLLGKNILLDEHVLNYLYQLEINSSKMGSNSTVVVSCKQWSFLKSYLTTIKTCKTMIMMQKCNNRKYNLLKIKEKNIFLVTYNNMLEAVKNLITYWNYENVIFYIDSFAGIRSSDLKKYLKLLRDVDYEVVIVNSTTNLLEKISQPEKFFLNAVIMCSSLNTNKIIEMVKMNDIFQTTQRWVIVNDIFPKALEDAYISPESQVTWISSIRTTETERNHNEVLENQQDCYNDTSKNAINIILKADDVSAIDSKLSSTAFMYDVFYSNLTHQIEFVKFASWTVQEGLHILENLDSNDIILRLRGRHIRTSAFLHLPYVLPTQTNGTISASGLNVEIMDMLIKYFNAVYSTKHYAPSWGLPLNGSYTGSLGVAYRKEVDIPLNGFMLAGFRLKIFRYAAPFAKIDMSISYETPAAIVPPTTYALPFSISVWISIFIVFFCTLISLAISMYFSPTWKVADLPSISFHSRFYRLRTGTFFEEVLDNVPPSVSSKVIFGTLLLATLSIYVFYTSIFTSVLAYRELKMPICNLHDLIENRDYTPMTVKSTVFDSLFRSAQTGLFKALWKRMSKNEQLSVQPLDQTIKSMYVGKNVLVTDGASTVAAMNNNCSISLIKTRLFQEYIFLVTRTDFPYSRMFYIRLLKITEGGILRRFGKKYMTESRPPCPVEEPSLTLGLLQVVGLFFVLGCGLVLSITMLLLEVCYTVSHRG